MRNYYTIPFAAFISFSLCISAVMVFPPANPESNAVISPGETESPLELKEWEHARYADPATGRIPTQALWNAYRQLIAQGKVPDHPFTSNTSRNEEWEPVNDFFSSIAITKITYDPLNPLTFYFCTGEGWYNADASIGAGVWKSIDGGGTWSQLPSTDISSFDYCQDIDVHPVTGDIYVSTLHGGLMRSQDEGATFHQVLNVGGSLNNGICDVEFTKNGGIFAAKGIFQTGAIYYSETGDSGTWVMQANGFPVSGLFRIEMATAPSNDSVAYAIATNSTDYGIKGFYKTIDKGNSWFSIPDPGGNLEFAKHQAWYDLILGVDPNDENIVVAGGWQLWRSKDGGNTWFQLGHGNPDSTGYQYFHVDQHAIQFRNSDTIYFGNDGGIWKSGNFSDEFPTIYERNYGYRVTQYYAGDLRPEAGAATIIGGTQDNGSNKLSFGGISTYEKLTWADGGFCAINYDNPNFMYTTKNSNGTYRFTNGGYGTPDTITNPYVTDANVQFINPIVLDPNDMDLLYMGSSKGLYRLKNASVAEDSSWELASKTIGPISVIAVSKSQPHTVFIGKPTGGNVWRLEHADTTGPTQAFKDCDPSGQLPSGSLNNSVYCSCVYVDPQDANHVYATFSNYGIKNIWESTNATGTSPTWKTHDGDLPNLPVNWFLPNPFNTEIAYIGTDLGVFYTNKLDGDSTVWLPSNTGLANVRVSMLVYRASDHTMLAVTHGRGMFIGTVPDTGPDYSIVWNERGPLDIGGRTRSIMIDPNDPTGQTIWVGSVSGGLWKTTAIDAIHFVGTTEASSLTVDLDVSPNPVGEMGTTISFSFSEHIPISVFICDQSGATVATLFDRREATGDYQVKWIPGKHLSNGIYFVCLVSGNKKDVRKVVLVR